MEIQVTDELVEICRRIVAEDRSEDEWASMESDDMFQTQNYVGGFDATEGAFCFSFFGASRQELWFQMHAGAGERDSPWWTFNAGGRPRFALERIADIAQPNSGFIAPDGRRLPVTGGGHSGAASRAVTSRVWPRASEDRLEAQREQKHRVVRLPANAIVHPYVI